MVGLAYVISPYSNLFKGSVIPSGSEAGVSWNLSKSVADVAEVVTANVHLDVPVIQDVIGAKIQLAYDPLVLRVVDADSATPGIQVDTSGSDFPLEVTNGVNALTGTIDIELAQNDVDTTIDGDVTLFTVSFFTLKPTASTSLEIVAD
jgi:hypothetical protein